MLVAVAVFEPLLLLEAESELHELTVINAEFVVLAEPDIVADGDDVTEVEAVVLAAEEVEAAKDAVTPLAVPVPELVLEAVFEMMV